ncbi:MAG: cyanophycinase [Woeseiaceae bacterium]|nr:cyanophycinase [Woeseiaceae bacterium]
MAAVSGVAAADAAFDYYVAGDPADVETPTRGLVVLQGGGDDVDENYRAMAEHGGGGDFVVLRASGADEYNDYILERCDCDSVQTIVFGNRQAAFDPEVVGIIRNAEMLFIAGGDQSRYVRFWKDTPVERAIRFVAAKPAPVGGTSAGMAVLGGFVYSAMGLDSLTSPAALADPYHHDLTLERDLFDLPPLEQVLTDQHLLERDRMGRTVAMLARLMADGWATEARAIAADRETALHIDPVSGRSVVRATADHETPYVYLLRARRPPAICEAGRPLIFEGIEVRRLSDGDSFDVIEWSGDDGVGYELNVRDGVLSSSRDSVY